MSCLKVNCYIDVKCGRLGKRDEQRIMTTEVDYWWRAMRISGLEKVRNE
jgi:hypothetical protein